MSFCHCERRFAAWQSGVRGASAKSSHFFTCSELVEGKGDARRVEKEAVNVHANADLRKYRAMHSGLNVSSGQPGLVGVIPNAAKRSEESRASHPC